MAVLDIAYGPRVKAFDLIETQRPSGVTSVTFSGLNGDADEIYIIDGYIVDVSGSSAAFAIKLNNGSMTNQAGYVTNTTFTGVRSTYMMFSRNGPAVFQAYIYAKTGADRVVQLVGAASDGSIATDMFFSAAHYNNTNTNVTSIVIEADIASSIGAGSVIRLLRGRV